MTEESADRPTVDWRVIFIISSLLVYMRVVSSESKVVNVLLAWAFEHCAERIEKISDLHHRDSVWS